MPGKTGLEVVRDIRTRDTKVPIIMITTEAERATSSPSSRHYRLLASVSRPRISAATKDAE